MSLVKLAVFQESSSLGSIATFCSIMRREGIKKQIFNYKKNRMAQPESNGLFEVNSNSKVMERGFFCMKLVDFLNDEVTMGTEEYANLWEERFNQAKTGVCAYREKCPNYSKTIENKPVQLKLF